MCYVNKHIYKEQIKLEDLKLMEQFLNPYEYMCAWLNKAIIILIFISQIKSFLVLHERLGENLLFCIYVSPVLTNVSTVYIYKIMRCLVKNCRINAIRIACFLDDGLGVVNSYTMTLFHSNSLMYNIQLKSKHTSTSCQYNGVYID